MAASNVSVPFAQIGVAIEPGSTTTTSICFHGFSSRRSESAMPSRPNLAALYGEKKGEATRPPIEVMKTIVPPPRRSSGRKAWVTAYWPTRLTSITFWNSSTGRCSTGPAPAMPALLTSPARPRSPTACSTSWRAASIEGCSATSIVTGVSRSEPSSARLSASACLRTPAKTLWP